VAADILLVANILHSKQLKRSSTSKLKIRRPAKPSKQGSADPRHRALGPTEKKQDLSKAASSLKELLLQGIRTIKPGAHQVMPQVETDKRFSIQANLHQG